MTRVHSSGTEKEEGSIPLLSKILVVDDSLNFLFGVASVLRRAGFDVVTAKDGVTGLRMAKDSRPDLILLDINMPGMNGFDVKMALDQDPATQNIPVVFLSAFNDRLHTMIGLNLAEDYISKPFDGDVLVTRLRAIFRRISTGYKQAVVDWKSMLFAGNQYQEWGLAVEMHDYGTAGHTQRVTSLFVALARRLGLGGIDLENAKKGATLHDIGKLAVPEAILNKPGPLDAEEWKIIRRHPQTAVEMLSAIETLQPALEIPRYHHERWDGKGYPNQLRGEEIPLAARIFSVVDVFDALISKRPYKTGLAEIEAVEIIRSQSGQQFDPAIVTYFLEHLNSLKEEASNGYGKNYIGN